MTTTNKILLIDGNNLAHRARHRFIKFSNKEGKSSSVAFGAPKIISSLLRRFPSDICYAVFDGGRAAERLALLPGYKDRDKKDVDDGFEEQMEDLMTMLSHMNVRVVHSTGKEADDYIYGLCRAHPRIHKTIVSSDKDFIPLLNEYTKIFNPFKDKIISTINVHDVYGFSHREFVDYLILKGDKSDGIPGVSGLGDKRIRDFLDTYESIDGYFEAAEAGKSLGVFDKYFDQIDEVYDINLELINLRYFWTKHYRGKVAIPSINKGWDYKVVSKLAFKYSITSFRDENFQKPFKKLESGSSNI